jgi:UDPglucose 6-dehydrogenase
MRVCVMGLWHLGTVTAACLASVGHEVVGLDLDPATVTGLQAGRPPVFEPGLAELVNKGVSEGCLRFTTDVASAVDGADVIWVAYDTPVDDEDRADVDYVLERVSRLYPYLSSGTLVLISSQLPVGMTRRLEQAYAASGHQRSVCFAYSPENLRLGRAIGVFTQPDRVVVGVRSAADRARVSALFKPFTEHIEWMSVESAEMTKHALNAFLATSVTFINEIAVLCEQVGADAQEVERGLKSEVRIGPRAYLSPGGAFAGGTLARDIAFLTQIGATHRIPTHLMAAVRQSNEAHKGWPRRKLQAVLGDLRGRVIAVWGLTYKPGTDTLRRSSAVELCKWLHAQGALVQAHDPAVVTLPDDLSGRFRLCASPLEALSAAEGLVVATEWPDYRELPAQQVVDAMKHPLVLDANRFLRATLGSDPHIHYVAVGVPG